MGDFLKNLAEFATALETCQEDNRLEKEKLEREARRAARKAQAEKDTKNGKSADPGPDGQKDDGQLMNQLMAAMMTRKRK